MTVYDGQGYREIIAIPDDQPAPQGEVKSQESQIIQSEGTEIKIRLLTKIININSSRNVNSLYLKDIFALIEESEKNVGTSSNEVEWQALEKNMINLFIAVIKKINDSIQVKRRYSVDTPNENAETALINKWVREIKKSPVHDPSTYLPLFSRLDQDPPDQLFSEIKQKFKTIIEVSLQQKQICNSILENSSGIIPPTIEKFKMGLFSLVRFLETYNSSSRTYMTTSNTCDEIDTIGGINQTALNLKAKAGFIKYGLVQELRNSAKEQGVGTLEHLHKILDDSSILWCESSFKARKEIQLGTIELLKEISALLISALQTTKSQDNAIIQDWVQSMGPEVIKQDHTAAWDLLKKVQIAEKKLENIKNAIKAHDLATLFVDAAALLPEIRINLKAIVHVSLTHQLACHFSRIGSNIAKEMNESKVNQTPELRQMLEALKSFLINYTARIEWLYTHPEVQKQYKDVSWLKL